MDEQELQTLFDAKLVEHEPNRFLLAKIQKNLLFKWFVLGFQAVSLPTPMTVEEKVANAAFYVDEFGSRYKIDFYIVEERWFEVSNIEKPDDTFIIHYDSIPVDAYFLGTVRL